MVTILSVFPYPPGCRSAQPFDSTRASNASGSLTDDPLHDYFVGRLEPVCASLLAAAAASGEIRAGQNAYELMRAVSSLCAGGGTGPYDVRHLVGLLVAGLRTAGAARA